MTYTVSDDRCPECQHYKAHHGKHGCDDCARHAEWDWDLPTCERVYVAAPND